MNYEINIPEYSLTKPYWGIVHHHGFGVWKFYPAVAKLIGYLPSIDHSHKHVGRGFPRPEVRLYDFQSEEDVVAFALKFSDRAVVAAINATMKPIHI